MSSIGQEFFDFIKILEDNGDKLPLQYVLKTIPKHPEEVECSFDNSSCHICNGYYGSSFGEPVCLTCHTFLFPDFASYLPMSYFTSDKTDDGDSGNDEPSDLNFGSERRSNRSLQLLFLQQQNSMEQDQSPDNEVLQWQPNNEPAQPEAGSSMGMAPPPVPPSVARTLHMLSVPRPQDDLLPGMVESLPPEVLLSIFGYLDDLSLCAVWYVCKRWRNLLTARVPSEKWAYFTKKRWPLFKPLIKIDDWCQVYRDLVNSCFCRNCLLQMAVQSQAVGEENTWRTNRLRVEIKIMRVDPPEGISAVPLDAKCCHWQASITGPVGSPYEGGLFYLYMQVPLGYPISPPIVRFLTKIFHPNVSRHGDVGIDSVQNNWSLALTLSKVLISIQSLLTDPYTDICMEPDVGRMYSRDRARFEEIARKWTWRYAMHDAINPATLCKYI